MVLEKHLIMIRLISMFVLLTLNISCQGQSKMETEVLVTDIKAFEKVLSNRKKTNNERVYVDISQKLEPQILIHHKQEKEIIYRIQGNVKSGGLSINAPKKIVSQHVMSNDTLIITNTVNIVGIAGKEGNNIKGYNYQQDEKLPIPNKIKIVKIQLYEEFSNQKSKEDNKIVLLTDKTIEINNN